MLTPSFVSPIEPPLATHEVFTSNDLTKHIQVCASEDYTGRLDLAIKDSKSQHWSLYFYRGGLIWGTSDLHPIRRWCRQLALHCPQLVVDSVLPQCWDYESLIELVKQGKVQQGQMAAMLEGNITEILFDIHQRWERIRYRSELQLVYGSIPHNTLKSTDLRLGSISVGQTWQRAMQAWTDWQSAALIDYSPNLAPVVWKADELRWQTSPLVYRNLTTLADGTQTLRDLAVKLKQNLLPLTQSILPYIRKGSMGLVEVGDLSYSIKPVTAANHSTPITQQVTSVQPQLTSPLVVCIDDSPIDSLTMGHILTQAGYQFIHIQDPVKALPTLLEHKPGLIFLDLIMPVINGYEICGQIRRISAFKDTPVIILTSNDGIVDRVRAKMVGSSGFLAKPIDAEKVLTTLQRYLPTFANVQAHRPATNRDWVQNQ